MAVAIAVDEQDVYPPRVLVSVTGLTIGDAITVYRVIDGERTALRGGSNTSVTDTSFLVVDAELPFGVPVSYLAVVENAYPVSLVGSGTAAESTNTVGTATLSPAVPSGSIGDLLVMQATIRNSGTGTVNTPTGWTPLLVFGNMSIFGKVATAGTETAPVVSFTGGVAQATVIARVRRFANLTTQVINSATQLNASAQNIAYPALTVTQDRAVVLFMLWKQDDATSMTGPGADMGSMTSSASGDDALIWSGATFQTVATNITAGSATVTGGGAAISRAAVLALAALDEKTYTTGAVTYTLPGGKVVVSDAISGAAAEAVILAWDDKNYDRQASVFRVGGRNVVVAGDLGMFASEIEFYVETSSARDNLMDVLATATAGTVQIRQPGGYDGVDSYLAVTGAAERRFSQDGSDERRRIAVQVAQVESWAPALESPGYTLQDLADTYTGLILADFADDYATLLAAAQGEYS